MKTIGLLGGMSWESSDLYYQHLNRRTRERLGGLHSANILMKSLDFAEIEHCQMAGDWATAEAILIEAALDLESGGARCLVICTNTMHRMAEGIQKAIAIPLLHIADATADEIERQGLKKPLLLGTRFTMEQDFYKGRLQQRGLGVVVPDEADRKTVHDIIYDELCRGIVRAESKQAYLEVLANNQDRIDSVILGCTEIGMLIKQSDTSLPVLDTTLIHAEAALDFALVSESMPVAEFAS
jgi:aspartate racemase